MLSRAWGWEGGVNARLECRGRTVCPQPVGAMQVLINVDGCEPVAEQWACMEVRKNSAEEEK